jgi:hypothetical protein
MPNQENNFVGPHIRSTLKRYGIGMLCVGLSLGTLPVPAAQYFVAPNGKDSDNGTRARPFATLERARLAVRTATTRGENAEVILRGGTYELQTPLELGKDDSGQHKNRSPGAPPPAKPRVSAVVARLINGARQ